MNVIPLGRDRPGASLNEDGPKPNSPLVNYALRGLERCWLPEHGRWSHIYHLDGRKQPNESLPHSDVFYTLNVLLGMSRLKERPGTVRVREIFERNALLLTRLPIADYALGVALWAAAELRLEIAEAVRKHIARLLSDRTKWLEFRAQDTGMILMGVVAQASAGNREWRRFAGPLFEFLTKRYHSRSGLFFDAPSGLRRRFSSFATQTYLAMACYHYGEFAGDLVAIEMANACTRRLIAQQGPQGEWPWFFDTKRGAAVDFYEVYSVHQYGMAPALLECAERHGVREARVALIKGFNWVLGDNQLAMPMLAPGLQLSIRSQVRKRELHTKALRMLRALQNTCLRRPASLVDPDSLTVRRECRSYELGWILWSFGQRSDLSHLTHNPIFTDALA
ncbi:MAG: hypothetical protein WA792_08960 [Pseudolabrys sp.]